MKPAFHTLNILLLAVVLPMLFLALALLQFFLYGDPLIARDSKEFVPPVKYPVDAPAATPDLQLASLTNQEVSPTPLGSVDQLVLSEEWAWQQEYINIFNTPESKPSWYVAPQTSVPLEAGNQLVNKLSLALTALSALLALVAGWIIFRSSRQAQSQPAFPNLPNLPNLNGAQNYRHQPDTPVPAGPDRAVQEVSQRLVAVQESVRREMADYLHGHVQSKLLALSLSLGTCQKMLDQDPAHACRLLERIQDELQKLQDEDLREVSRELYPAIVKMGLVPAMRSLVSRFSDMMEIDLTIDQKVFALDKAGDSRLPERQRLGIYRIAEEALNNVLKHANAKQVKVSLTCDAPDQLVLSVVDDGHGFDQRNESTCHGLVMMSDYAEAIGGKTEITSFPGQGTAVRLALSLSQSDLADLAALVSQSANPEQTPSPSAI